LDILYYKVELDNAILYHYFTRS